MKYNRIACVLIIHVILMGCQVQNNDVVRDCIGLSKHIRHMRWTPDTIAVNTKYCGWTADSIRVYESITGFPTVLDKTFFFTENDRNALEINGLMRKRFGWLNMIFNRNKILFTAQMTQGERRAMLYIHKDNFADSILITQSVEMLGSSVNERRYIDLWPNSMEVNAGGGKVEATTKGSEWWIDRIVFSDNVSGNERTYIPTKKQTKRWRTARKRVVSIRYVTVRSEGKEVEIHVAPNKTGKRRDFIIFLACEEKETMASFYGRQE